MMADLFASEVRFSDLSMPDADVSFLVEFPFSIAESLVFQRLREETVWLHEEVVVWGKRHKQPRLTAWYGDPDREYTYSGTVMSPLPWTDLLLQLKAELEMLTQARFNSVLLNQYRDQNDRMGFHSDNEPSLGRQPIIASLSYGATRTLTFKHKKNLTFPLKHVKLTSGSLLLMRGRTQEFWKHGVNSETLACGPRINLTFRNILN